MGDNSDEENQNNFMLNDDYTKEDYLKLKTRLKEILNYRWNTDFNKRFNKLQRSLERVCYQSSERFFKNN